MQQFGVLTLAAGQVNDIPRVLLDVLATAPEALLSTQLHRT
jgi:hypothetical protein